MINLKLAEYKEGKFKEFHELSKGFGYFGNFIWFYHTRTEGHTILDRDVLYKEQMRDNRISYEASKISFLNNKEGTSLIGERYELDEKDPLNRFDGLFDGLTYGEGRFILIAEGFEHFYQVVECENGTDPSKLYGFLGNAEQAPFELNYKVIGNLIESPELWNKVK